MNRETKDGVWSHKAIKTWVGHDKQVQLHRHISFQTFELFIHLNFKLKISNP